MVQGLLIALVVCCLHPSTNEAIDQGWIHTAYSLTALSKLGLGKGEDGRYLCLYIVVITNCHSPQVWII